MSSRARPPAVVVIVLAVVSLVSAACGGDTRSTSAEEFTLPDCLTFEDIYALVGPESTGFHTWADANELAADLGSPNVPFPEAPLDIFGPGEESGTFDSFVELVLEPIAERRGQEDPLPRLDYQSSPNDNVIVQGVAASSSAFGWVGFAFYTENQQGIRAFEVDGGTGCTPPTDATIASGEYAISRPLFIYVNKDKAEEKPALAAFVDHYLSDEGIAAVSEAGYVPLDADALATTRRHWQDSGVAGAAASDLSGSISVSGSSTVEPITARVAEDFNARHADVDISVEGPGTGDGFQRFCAGETDISDASRQIKEEELEDCEETGVDFIELRVAIDGLTVLTSD